MTRARRILVLLAVTLTAFAAALAAAEIIARRLEPPPAIEEGHTTPLPDAVLGWIPAPGVQRVTTAEFSARYDINALNMNDAPVTADDRARPVRILALGDSHTFAVGVSRDEAWPRVLDAALFGGDRARGRVFNAGVPAYSLGQYLLRFRSLQPAIQPTLVLVAVSTATDLFDLLPPRLGGFVYGGSAGRTYFDLDERGQLVERTLTAAPPPASTPRRAGGFALRTFLRKFALYRRAQNSLLAMRIASAVRLPGGDPLWDGPDAVVRRDLTERERFQWALARAILERTGKEVRTAGAAMAIVVIPYLPEVYDEVWNASFGKSQDYDRFIGSRRLQEISAAAGAAFIDTTPALVNAVRQSHRWLHYPSDKHPTAEGQRVVAATVAEYLKAHRELIGQ